MVRWFKWTPIEEISDYKGFAVYEILMVKNRNRSKTILS